MNRNVSYLKEILNDDNKIVIVDTLDRMEKRVKEMFELIPNK